VRRKEFRVFAHPPDAMLGVLTDHGLHAALTHRGLAWHVEGLARSAADSSVMDATSPRDRG
jgi:hypothetical protein